MSIQSALQAIEKKYGKGQVIKMDDENLPKVKTTPSGSIKLNKALGGGYGVGRIIELFGLESSGKSTLALHALAEFQQLNPSKLSAYIDAEHSLDPSYASRLGVDLSRIYIHQPDNGEQALDVLRELINSGDIGMAVVDSVAALTPKAEIDGEVGDAKVGLLARVMSQAMRMLTGSANNNECTVIFINQLREKIGVMYGDNKVTTGGNALKFYASQRLEVVRVGNEKDKDNEVTSSNVKIKVKKNKIGVPFKEVIISFKLGEGIDKLQEIIDLAIEFEIIKKAGSWYSYGDVKLGQGEALVKAILQDNIELLEEIINKIKEKLCI